MKVVLYLYSILELEKVIVCVIEQVSCVVHSGFPLQQDCVYF